MLDKQMMTKCKDCNGDGESRILPGAECPNCDGQGEFFDYSKMPMTFAQRHEYEEDIVMNSTWTYEDLKTKSDQELRYIFREEVVESKK